MRAAVRKIAIVAAAIVTIAATTVALPTSADARWGGHWHGGGGHWHGGWGGWGAGVLAPAWRSVSLLLPSMAATAMAPTMAPMDMAAAASCSGVGSSIDGATECCDGRASVTERSAPKTRKQTTGPCPVVF